MDDLKKPLSKEAAHDVWNLLVDLGGAYDGERNETHFVQCQTDEFIREWRFQGIFGFGGKFYRDSDRWCVGNYSEDDSPETDCVRDEINGRLAELYAKHVLNHG